MFEIIEKCFVASINSEVVKMVHKRTGMNILRVKNDDKNKVFAATFRTPPSDNTGAPHILEHSVLCGSKKFRAKDLFNEIMKGSINTYLNAMTFSDKTMYPAASLNDKDFFNLTELYLDAVFNPLLHEIPEFFAQEGWCFSLAEKNAPLEINGIVYNEMKGAHSNPERILIKKIDEALFADTPYEYDSGGIPRHIPSLSYEKLLEFYDTYYSPSNCLLYLYGDLDEDKALALIDEAVAARSAVKLPEMRFTSDVAVESDICAEYYSVNDEKQNGAFYAISLPACDYTDYKTAMALEILNYVLAGTNASPLKHAMRQSGVCGDFSAYYRTGAHKTSFSFVGKDCSEGKFNEFENEVKKALLQIRKNGIDGGLIRGALNKWEFFINEEEFGARPKGLFYGISAASAWVYGGDLYGALDIKGAFEEIKAEAQNGLFDRLFVKYLIENDNVVKTELLPKAGLIKTEEDALKLRLSEYKSALSDGELKELVSQTKKLERFKKEPVSKKLSDRIPHLLVSDLKAEPQKLEYDVCDGNTVFCRHDKENIDYVNLSFDLSRVPKALLPYCGLLKEVLGKTDTETYTSKEIIGKLDVFAGGVSYTADCPQADKAAQGRCFPRFNIKLKALSKNTDTVLKLMSEVVAPKLNEAEIGKIVNETLLKAERMFLSQGHTVAINRSLSYIFEYGGFLDMTAGIAFYNELCGKSAEEICEKLREAIRVLFTAENLSVGVSANAGDYRLLREVSVFVKGILQKSDAYAASQIGVNESKNEGFIIDGGVCYNAAAFNLYDVAENYSGKLQVAKSILTLEHLWTKIRNEGGAYGCGVGFARSGAVYFSSYRDAEITRTFDVFKNSFKFLSEYGADKKHFQKLIVNSIKPYEKPLSPVERLELVQMNRLLGITDEMRRQERYEILSASGLDINNIGEILRAAENKLHICTLGNKSKVEAENIFGVTKILNRR